MGFKTGDRVVITWGDLEGEKAEVVYALKDGRYFVIADDFSTSKGQRVFPEHKLALDVPPPPPPPPPGTWFVSPLGDDSADGLSESTAFRSFGRAYLAANPGDVVDVLPGVYGRQVLRRRPELIDASAAARVLFIGRNGVSLNALSFGANYDDLGARNVQIANMSMGWLDAFRVEDLAFTDVRTRGVTIAGGDRITFRGGEWGDQSNPTGAHPEFSVWRGQVPVRGLIVDGVHIHRIGRPPRPWPDREPHTNAFHVWGSGHRDITVRNCTFEANDVFHILFGGDGPGSIQNVVLEDNLFLPVTDAGFQGTGFYSVKVEGVRGFVARRNTFSNPASLKGDVEAASACGNLGNCPASWQSACP